MATDRPSDTRDLLTPRKIAVQLVGFGIGLALLTWIVVSASKGDWSKILDGDPWLVAGLAGCSLVSLIVNGAAFWVVIRPVRPLRFVDQQLINMVTGVLNYAPIRLGLIARAAYALRVDRQPVLETAAWFAAIAFSIVLPITSCIAASLIHNEIDVVWFGLVVAQVLLGGLLTMALLGQSIVVRYGRGMDRMLSRPSALWGAVGLRLVDIAAFTGRMFCAVKLLGLGFEVSEIVLLAVTTIALSLNPLGRLGYREFGVAMIGRLLASTSLDPEHATLQMEQLALIESAGEAMVFIPTGALALLWYRYKWRQAGKGAGAEPIEDLEEAVP